MIGGADYFPETTGTNLIGEYVTDVVKNLLYLGHNQNEKMSDLSIHKQIEKRIRQLKRGSIIVPDDFSDTGEACDCSPKYVAQTVVPVVESLQKQKWMH